MGQCNVVWHDLQCSQRLRSSQLSDIWCASPLLRREEMHISNCHSVRLFDQCFLVRNKPKQVMCVAIFHSFKEPFWTSESGWWNKNEWLGHETICFEYESVNCKLPREGYLKIYKSRKRSMDEVFTINISIVLNL